MNVGPSVLLQQCNRQRGLTSSKFGEGKLAESENSSSAGSFRDIGLMGRGDENSIGDLEPSFGIFLELYLRIVVEVDGTIEPGRAVRLRLGVFILEVR